MSNATEPMRRCIGCMESKAKSQMYRIAMKDGNLTFDANGKEPGRGVYLCKSKECIETARKKNGLQRGFKRSFSKEITEAIFKRADEEISNAE